MTAYVCLAIRIHANPAVGSCSERCFTDNELMYQKRREAAGKMPSNLCERDTPALELTDDQIRSLPRWLPLVDAGALCGWGPDKTRRLARNGKLPFSTEQDGNGRRVHRNDLMAYLRVEPEPLQPVARSA